MAKQCDQCGKVLPNDTIRYCPGCGKLITPSRPAKKPISEDPPAWMKQLETSLTTDRSNVPLREPNVKIWEEEETRTSMSSESGEDEAAENIHKADALPTSPLLIVSSPKNTPSQISSSLSGIDVSEEENLAEELPTNPYMTSFSHIAAVNHSSSSSGIDFDNRSMSHEQVEDIATRPYAAQPRNLSQEVRKLVQNQQGHAVQTPPVYMNSPAVERPVTPVPLSLPQSQLPPFQSATQTPPGTMPVAPLPEPKKSTRKRFIIGLGLLFVLLIGGIIAWVILAQPFTVPEITRTTQNFTDTSLGVSLQYPRNWTVAVNKQARTVHLYDANHTDQVNITVVVASNQNMNQYVSKTVSTLGITGQRTLSQASFAGATWQRIQGSVQQNGANYTATILVTMRDQSYYTIEQLAPSTTYSLEEQLVFSKMRSSFQF